MEGKPGYRFFTNADIRQLSGYEATAEYFGVSLHTELAFVTDGTPLSGYVAIYIPKHITWEKFYNELPWSVKNNG